MSSRVCHTVLASSPVSVSCLWGHPLQASTHSTHHPTGGTIEEVTTGASDIQVPVDSVLAHPPPTLHKS
jgi:hypothetical protein